MKKLINWIVICIMCLSIVSCAPARKWSTADKLFLAGSIASSAADYYTTKRALDNPNNYEMNPIYGKHPSDAQLIGTLAASQLIIGLIAHFFPKVRKPVLGLNIGVHGWAAYHNSQLE